MKPLSRAWGYVLLALQILNALAATTAHLGSMVPDDQKPTVLAVNLVIASVVGAVQAFAKALPDVDGDGIPDPFDSSVDPSPPKP